MPFFFIGFVFATFMTTLNTGVTLVALGILGVCLAFIYVQLNPEFQEPARLPQPVAAGSSGGGGADLDDDLDDELD